MNKGQKAAIIIDLADELLERGSWCGETHIQKAVFLLQEVLRLDSGFEFILYKHGPFSFELRDQLIEMTADGLLEYVVRHPGYGPTLVPTAEKYEFNSRFPKTLTRHKERLQFVADFIGNRGVVDLERLATAIYVTARLGTAREQRASVLVELKPHISIAEAEKACAEADVFSSKGQELSR